MRRAAAGLVVLGLIAGLLWWAPWSSRTDWSGLRSWVSSMPGYAPSERCEVPLADGRTRTVSPRQAARLATAGAGAGQAVVATKAHGAGAADLTRPAGLTCTLDVPRDLAPQGVGPTGLTQRAQRVLDEVMSVFGPVPAGGFAPEGVSTGHGVSSKHYQGLAVDLFFRPYPDPEQQARGWSVASWLVANAKRLDVHVVIYDDRIWSTTRSSQGWRPYSNPSGADDPVSRHLDHVHVDVFAGG